ncbi:MAG: NADH-ubiquinone oxidoreductase-F iron-sulfur binding region domain-containing protein [Planctomycetota bacterium]
MVRLKSVGEFVDFRQRVLRDKSMRAPKPTLVICAGTGGQASGSNDVMRIIKRTILEQGLSDRLDLRITGCQGFCEMDPFIVVEPGSHLYPRLKMDDVPRVIAAALSGHVDEELIYRDSHDGKKYHSQQEIPFFRKQTRTLLGDNPRIDPIRLYHYLENDGYGALEKVLLRNDPEWIIAEVKTSGLRGRGGAGFPTGTKWERARAAGRPGQRKFIVCNCDEGDPGAYMDRSLLEGNPHAIIEGMLIAGIAIGANRGVVYVRLEYPLAIKHTLIALQQARDLGLLGSDILGTGLDFDIDIVRGAGAFVCGEETALIKSVEGRRGEPRQRPPYPIEKGIENCPTCINNVETLANIPVVVKRGGAEFAKVGVPGNTGTKIFSLVGKVRNTGLVEVPLGITIGEVVHDIGGGPVGEAKIKAVQTGGPSGGCIPARMFDLGIDYDSLTAAGTIMGSGGMIVMDDNTCMVDVAKYFMNFLKEESCGKCFTCRKGTQRMWELLDDISRGLGTPQHLDLLEELAHVVQDTSMCGLGQTASNPVLSTLRYFKDEYKAHIEEERCPAGVCRELVGAPCQSSCPIGTEAWRYVAHIARGEYEKAYLVIREANPFPSVCARVCNHPCEEKCRAGAGGGQALAVRALKRFITDRIDPSTYKPKRHFAAENLPKVAIVGSGPAGLTAAHYLGLRGFRVTVLEAEDRLGGMLFSAIPAYRLPREVMQKEIESLLLDNITVVTRSALGREVTIDGLFAEGFKAVFLALGAHKSLALGIEGESSSGVIPSIQFLKAFNMRGESLAKGRVGVIGGGNSAVDAARVALRQKDVKSVTIYYRRTVDEMPAFEEEVEAAVQEGVVIQPLVGPVKFLTKDGKLTGLVLVRNEPGPMDSSGRRKPVPVRGSEFEVELDTAIVAISEGSDTDCIQVAGAERIKTKEGGTIEVDPDTLLTNRPGVFAGGDVVTGPNTVIDAIAAGKRVAIMIERYLAGENLEAPIPRPKPRVYVEPLAAGPLAAGREGDELIPSGRAELPRAPVEWRRRGFAEVEMSLSEAEARTEARRCLRCDLEFTRPLEAPSTQVSEPCLEGKQP